MQYEQELAVARAAAEQAGNVQLEAQPTLDRVDIKDDDSPVTEVDRRCEQIIRAALLEAFPDDGFLGEESGEVVGTTGRTWIVDPLDGTRPFIRGIPTYSSLVGLEADGKPVVGVIHLAALGETYWAAAGGGAFRNGEAIRVSETREMGKAMGSALGHVQEAGTAMADRVLRLMGEWDYDYGFMDNYSYALVADGRLDLCVNMLDKPWDCAAAACIVSEAGGSYSDINGNPSVRNHSIVLSNGVLHDEAIAYLNASP